MTLRPARITLAGFALYFLLVVPRLIWRDETGLWVGHEHLWSDWPLHIAMLRRFADCTPDQWLAQHPMIGGIPLRYPFGAALLSGLLVRLGLPVPAAIVVPTLVLLVLLVAGVLRLWTALLGSERRAAVATILFFLAAGPGGFSWFLDLVGTHGHALLDPPREYGRVDEYGWYAGNFLVGMLLPQRAFLPGMTAGIWILVAWQSLLADGAGWPQRRRQWTGFALGAAAGFLPLLHVHSVLAVAVFGAALWIASVRSSRAVAIEAALHAAPPAALLAATFMLTLLRPDTPFPHFVSWKPGFVATGPLDWLRMWWLFWGIALPLAALGTRRCPLAWGAWLLFLAGNLILFQPIPWDNSKVFLWVYFGLCGALTRVLAWLWRRRWLKFAAPALAFALTLTGLLNFVQLSRTDLHRYQILGNKDLAVGEAIRRGTRQDAVILTEMDTSNGPMVWGARPIYLGFGGWMANFHFDHAEREANLRAIYAGGADAEARLRDSGVSYVLVGPGERGSLDAKDKWFASRFPVFAKVDDLTVYTVRR